MSTAAPFRASRTLVNTSRPMTVVASSRRVDLSSRKRNKLGRIAQNWQDEAWVYFDEIPEIKYSVRHFGDAMAKLILTAVWDDPGDSRDPVPLYDDEGELPEHAEGLTDAIAMSAIAEIVRLDAGAAGGIPALLARMNQNFEIPGECWFVGYGETVEDAERWEIRSYAEVVQRSGAVYIRDSPDQRNEDQYRLDEGNDTLIRLWLPHAKFHAAADSPMRAALVDCRALIGLSNEIIAETNSQASAGVLLIPNEVSDGSPDPNDPDSDDEDPFMTELEAALVDPIIDPESPRAVAPTIIRGDADALEQVRHITFGRDRGEVLSDLVEARIQRLARGMNMPVETVMGHQSTTFTNAERIDQNEWDDHYEPRARLITAALTGEYLRPNMLDAGHNPDVVAKIKVWGDGSALISEPDTEKNAKEAHSQMTISDAAYRTATGFTDADAPDEEELLRRQAMQFSSGVDVAMTILQQALADKIGMDITPEEPAVISEQPSPDSEPAARLLDVIEASSRPVPDYGRMLMEIDRDLRTRLVMAADSHLTRALERAGAKLRTSRQVRDIVASQIRHAEVASTIGADGIEAAGFNAEDLIEGAFVTFETQFKGWVLDAVDATLDVIADIVEIDDADRAMITDEFSDHIASGWSHLIESLERVTIDEMTTGALTAASNPGEVDPSSLIPTGLIRQALAVIGGQVETSDDPNVGAWVSLTPFGTPAGGVATGERMRRTMRTRGAEVQGFRWVYGPGIRQTKFEPHRRLDGREFDNFDDDVLANTTGWPPFAFYMPGDHAGCKCDVEPIIRAPKDDR